MTMYKLFSTEHAQTSLADCYRILAKINDEPLVESAKQKILSAIEDLNKVSEGIAQQLEEKR